MGEDPGAGRTALTDTQDPERDSARDRTDARGTRRHRRGAGPEGRRQGASQAEDRSDEGVGGREEGAAARQSTRSITRQHGQCRHASVRDGAPEPAGARRGRRIRIWLSGRPSHQGLATGREDGDHDGRKRPRASVGRRRRARETHPLARPFLVRRGQAHAHRVQGRQPNRLGGCAHVLRSAGDLPRHDCADLDPWADRPISDATADQQPRASSHQARSTRSSPARSPACSTAGARRGSFSSSASEARSGRPRDTSRPSCAPRTRSTTSRRAARSSSRSR